MFSKKIYKKISTKYMTRISTYKYVFRFQSYKTCALKISRKIERKKKQCLFGTDIYQKIF